MIKPKGLARKKEKNRKGKKKKKKQEQIQLAAGSKVRAAGHQVQHCGTGAWEEDNQRGRQIGDVFLVVMQHRLHRRG